MDAFASARYPSKIRGKTGAKQGVKSVYLKDISKKKVLGYVLLPGIVPRVQELFEGSFGYIAFLMAQIYNMVRLLPNDHAYMNPQNIGTFSVRNVIAEAANHLVLKKENIDQIVIFFALLAGTILLILQLVILAYSLLIEPAMAQVSVPSAFSLFTTPDPSTGGDSLDVAFILMDRVFGVPDLFCTIGNKCTEVLTSSGPTPFHKGMQSMFQFYSLGMLLVGALIFLYFMIVVVVETAISGTPFGQRFQNVWVPVRLVVALGLLMPISYGYNTGQYIAFYAAKAGSGLATNGWNLYNKGLETGANTNPTGEQETLIPYPSPQSIAPVIQAMTIIQSCAYAYHRAHGERLGKPPPPEDGSYIQPYFVKNITTADEGETAGETSRLFIDFDYEEALKFYNGGNIIIRYGIKDEEQYSQYKGSVEPTCGEIKIPVHNAGLGEGEDGDFDDPLAALSQVSLAVISTLWHEGELIDFAQRMMEIKVKRHINAKNYPCKFAKDNKHFAQEEPNCYLKNPESTWRSELIATYQSVMNVELESSWEDLSKRAPFALSDEVKDRGWGGAGIWYNKIAQINGEFIATVMDVPVLSKYPLVMEQVRKSNLASNRASNSISIFMPHTANSSAGEYSVVTLEGGRAGLDIAAALSEVHYYWNTDGYGDIDQDNGQSSNFLLNMVNLLLGSQGLFDMRKNSRAHPLSQLVALGKGLVEAGIRNMAISGTSAFLGGIAGAFQNQSGAALLNALASMFKSTAFLGITAGFVLFYVVPFLPFIYTFFAVGGWIKTIFEAMVGIPLWALAHLRIDGEGLPGESAQNGYFLILEIFLRPVLTIFGLIAAITIFTAQVRVLNIVWDLVISNLGGFNDANDGSGTLAASIGFRRSSVDQFFFTILYAIVVYMMATGSFKLIDNIPKNILRWSGNGVSAFGDINEDPKGLEKFAAIGGITVGRQVIESAQKVTTGIGGTLGQSMAPRRQPPPSGGSQ